MIDIFNSNAFQTTTLDGVVVKLPFVPSRLGPAAAGGLGLFDERPIRTTTIAIEEVSGQLSLIGSSPRGAAGDQIGNPKRKLIPFLAQHLRRNAKVMADEVQGVRELGSEDAVRTLESVRDEKMRALQVMHEVTWEYHRMGALQGKVLDADGTTVLLDCFTAFDVAQQTHDIALSNANTLIRTEAVEIARLIEDELGGTMYQRLHALVGRNYMDGLLDHASVRDALKYTEGRVLLSDLRKGFTVGPITFEEHRGSVKNPASGDSVDFIGDDVGYVFPVGAFTPNGLPLFIGRFAPQPFFDTVNRLNPPLIVRPVLDPAGQFIELLGISCPLYLCTRPRAVIKLTKS